MKVSGWERAGEFGLAERQSGLGRLKEDRLFRDEKELLLVGKILRPGFTLLRLQVAED